MKSPPPPQKKRKKLKKTGGELFLIIFSNITNTNMNNYNPSLGYYQNMASFSDLKKSLLQYQRSNSYGFMKDLCSAYMLSWFSI